MKTLIEDVYIVNEAKAFNGCVIIDDEFIESVHEEPNAEELDLLKRKVDRTIKGEGKMLMPGVIDDQVHFREPGLTDKGDIASESKAAVAGGITSFMEMPNTNPKAVTIKELENKYRLASMKSHANYSFYMGATNDNFSEILKVDPGIVCGVKVFLGASTGNMLVDNDEALKKIFGQNELIVTIHSEDEKMIKENLRMYKDKYGKLFSVSEHPNIRSREACIASTRKAISLAQDLGTRLHVLHISTAEEVAMFEPGEEMDGKQITAEACVHHLWFSDKDYASKGAKIKWNPAIKTVFDRNAIREGVREGRINIVATDHAPHTWEEKDTLNYFNCPAGGPLVQHALVAMLELYHQNVFSLEMIVQRMCHAPAIRFGVEKRGFIRPGYYADLTLVDLNDSWTVHKKNILYKCKWSPFEDDSFKAKIASTWVNGNLVYNGETVLREPAGKRLTFSPQQSLIHA